MRSNCYCTLFIIESVSLAVGCVRVGSARARTLRGGAKSIGARVIGILRISLF